MTTLSRPPQSEEATQPDLIKQALRQRGLFAMLMGALVGHYLGVVMWANALARHAGEQFMTMTEYEVLWILIGIAAGLVFLAFIPAFISRSSSRSQANDNHS